MHHKSHDHPALSPALWALGTMSGTSLDGVDAAFVQSDGETITAFGPHRYRPYSGEERSVIARALGRWQGEPGVAEAAEVVELAHAELLTSMLRDFPDYAPSYIGFHGQTLAHAPHQTRTHQAGDGALLAEALGLPVVWDFRSADVALGGQGAPLAPFFHHACAHWARATEPLAILNLGGVGNLTWADPRLKTPTEDGALLAFDTGPANAPINDLMQARLGLPQDENGALAAQGQADEAVVTEFLHHSFFHRIPPKSLDRNDFHDLLAKVAPLSDADACATLTACAAASVANGLDHCPSRPSALYVTGGGRHNATMMRELATRTGLPTEPIETLGLNGDMLEAQAFAYLALRVARGLPTSSPSTTAVRALIGGGTLSRP